MRKTNAAVAKLVSLMLLQMLNYYYIFLFSRLWFLSEFQAIHPDS